MSALLQELPSELPRLNLYHNEIEADVAGKIAQGDYDRALYAIGSGVSSFFTSPYVLGHTLYLAGFDRLLAQLGDLMHDDPHGNAEWTPGPARMVILSEFYDSGGHSPVAADMVQAMGGAVVVLTDLFGRYRTGENMVELAANRMPTALVHRLLQPNLCEKVRELQTIFRAVRPTSVVFMVHHQDPIPYVAAASLPHSVKKIFIHHCDHNPALGVTLDGYDHVDLTQHLQEICAKNLQRSAMLLPLSVPDRGVKVFSVLAPGVTNIVTCGSSVKYKFDGAFAYHAVLAEILAACDGQYWHIGTIAEPALELIRSTLRERGIDASRFTHIPWVPSLWDKLKELDAHVYLGSFPVPGGRGSIEAQGCGYPVVYFASDDRPPLLRHADIFADSGLGWRSIPDLIGKLKGACEDHQQRVVRSRAFYLQGYSEGAFLRALEQIVGVE